MKPNYIQVSEYEGFARPKHHFCRHLSAALLRYGPLRGFWCMPWEGFLQVIKAIFKMTNYKNAPFTVCSFWSMKTALRMKNASESSWYNEIVYPCCDELDFDLRSAATNSALVSVLLIRMPELYAVRHLSSFERGSVEVKLGEYILFDEIEDLSDTAELAAIGGRVIEIVQAFSIGEAVLRIRLDNARRTGAVDVERGGVFTVLESEQCIADPVICDVERSTICELHAWLEDGRYTFTY